MNVVERSAKQSEAEFAAVRVGAVGLGAGDLDAFARAVANGRRVPWIWWVK